MNLYECLKTRSPITNLQILKNNNVIFSTLLHGIKIFTHDDCQVKLSLSNKYINTKTTAITFSDDGKLLAFCNDNTLYIVEIANHKIIKQIKINNESIDILTFDSLSTYIIAGTKSGRVLQYRYNSSVLLSRICSFPQHQDGVRKKFKQNFVSAFALYKNKIACSGYGGSIVVIDLHSKANKTIISNTNIRLNTLCFLDEDTLISANIDGLVQVISLKNPSLSKNINTSILNIKQMLIMPNPEFIMLSSCSNSLAIIDIKKYKLVNYNYLMFEDKVNKIAILNNGNLFVALNNCKLLNIELANTKQLMSLITHNSLDEAFELVANEPMIQNSKEHKILETKYQLYLEDTITALINNNKDLANQLASMFKNTAAKKDEIRELFKAFKFYNRFQVLFLEKKYALAYAMCSKYPALKYTLQYKKMEKIFKNAFSDAQRQMLIGREDIAKSILSEYMTVIIKRPLIKLILNYNKEFLIFLKAVESKDYHTIDKLAKENEIFTQIPTYISLNKEIANLFKDSKEYLRVGNIKLAKLNLEKLKQIDYLKDDVKELVDRCSQTQSLYLAYKKNDFLTSYQILDTYKHLCTTELGTLLEKHWSKQIIKCEEFALSGNLKNIKIILGELLTLNSRKEKIGELIRVSFHSKIKILIIKKSFKKAETIIYSYIDIFGLDNEIDEIQKKFESLAPFKLAINQGTKRDITRENWLNSDLIMN